MVVMHDLDARNEEDLRRELEGRVEEVGFRGHVILIPVPEIEAWLLADALALRSVFGMRRTPRVPAQPENVSHPKERLRDIVRATGGKRYVNTIHNKKIAAQLKISKLRRLRSFRAYPSFLQEHMGH